MLFTHHIIQFLTTFLALYVFYLGFQRFRSLHMNQKAPFKWNRHVILGQIILWVWLAGLMGGLVMVRIRWHKFLMTRVHGKMALIMFPLILFGLFSGLYMNRFKGKPSILSLIHGISNMIFLALALIQISTGWILYYSYLLVE